MMGIGQAAELPEGVAGKRLPPWLLPKVDNEARGKLRPDILIIEGLDSNTVPQPENIITPNTSTTSKILKKAREYILSKLDTP